VADLLVIEDGLRSMAATATRVQEVNKEAEDQYFQVMAVSFTGFISVGSQGSMCCLKRGGRRPVLPGDGFVFCRL
jgi:hypothetical protein